MNRKRLQSGERRGDYIHFGEGNNGWAFPDVTDPDGKGDGDPRPLRGMAWALRHLCITCPDNDTAVQKLLSLRRFYRRERSK